MNEPVIESPATRPAPAPNPVARMVGVITSPGVTFEDVARRPSWIAPVVIYVLIFTVVFGVYSMRADWVAILTSQIENLPLMGMLPEKAREEAVRSATAEIGRMSQAQQTFSNMASYPPFLLMFGHVLALIYATLFVLMGAVPKLELGKAWLNFLVCFLVFLAYTGIISVARLSFRDAIDSRIMLTALASIAAFVGWLAVMNLRVKADPEFRRIVAVVANGTAVLVVAALALLAVTLITPVPIQTPPEMMVKANVGALVKTGIPALQKLLESLDVFIVWFWVVLTLGLRPVTRLSGGVTAAITFLPWGVWVLLKVALTAVFG